MEQTFIGKLSVWAHHPITPNGGRVLMVHGLNEHSGRHLNTVEYLVKVGFEVVRFDLRGAGQSGGRKQYVDRFEDYVDDVNTVFNWINTQRSPLPLAVYGHSLGGAIAIHFASLRSEEFQALVLSAPAYLPGQSVPPFLIAISKPLSKFFPTLRVPNTGSKGDISRDVEAVKSYETDPLSFHFYTARQGTEMLRGFTQNPERVSKIRCPVMFVHGTADRIVKFEGSFQLMQRMPSVPTEFFVVPGGYHEPHNDFGKDSYFAFLESWLIRQLIRRRPVDVSHPKTDDRQNQQAFSEDKG